MRILNTGIGRLAQTEVVARFPADLTGELDSSKVYVIDGVIDMGADSINVPSGGLTIRGLGFNVSKLITSTASAILFDHTDAYSGDLFLDDLSIEVTGAGAKVFDLDNDENSDAVEVNAVNFNNCTSLGELSNYRQYRQANVAFFSILDGLTYSGTWSGGALWSDSIALFIGAGVTIFKEGTGLTFGGSVRCNMNALSINATTVFCDFQPSNILMDGEMDFLDFRAGNNDPLPNFPHTNVKARFRDCVGLINTYVGSSWEVTTGATTTISTANTLVKMAGTTTYDNEEWFSNSVSNAAVYDSTLVEEFEVEYSLSFTGSNNRVVGVQIRQWDDSASSYIDIGPRHTATMNGGGAGIRAENITGFAYCTLDQNDRIEIWVENQTDTSNITTDMAGSLFIKER